VGKVEKFISHHRFSAFHSHYASAH